MTRGGDLKFWILNFVFCIGLPMRLFTKLEIKVELRYIYLLSRYNWQCRVISSNEKSSEKNTKPWQYDQGFVMTYLRMWNHQRNTRSPVRALYNGDGCSPSQGGGHSSPMNSIHSKSKIQNQLSYLRYHPLQNLKGILCHQIFFVECRIYFSDFEAAYFLVLY